MRSIQGKVIAWGAGAGKGGTVQSLGHLGTLVRQLWADGSCGNLVV